MKYFSLIFLLLNFLILSFYIDSRPTWNTTSRALHLDALVNKSTSKIDALHHLTGDKAKVHQHYYSEKMPLPVLLAYPFYKFYKQFGFSFNTDQNPIKEAYFFGSLICSILPFLLLLFLTFKKLSEDFHLYKAALLSMLIWYSTFHFNYVGTFFAHILGGCFTVLAFLYLNQKNVFLTGLFLGLSVLCELNQIVVVLVFSTFVLFNNIKSLPIFLLGGLPSLLFLLFYNYYYTSNAFEFLYQHVSQDQFVALEHEFLGLSTINYKAIFAMLYSSAKSIFVFSPLLLLSHKLKGIKNIEVLLLSFVAMVIVISMHRYWWGGNCYGPRHLLTVAMPLLFCLSYKLESFKNLSVFYALALFGLILHGFAKMTTSYSFPSKDENVLMHLEQMLRTQNFIDQSVLTQFLGIKPVYGAVFFACMMASVLLFISLKAFRSGG